MPSGVVGLIGPEKHPATKISASSASVGVLLLKPAMIRCTVRLDASEGWWGEPETNGGAAAESRWGVPSSIASKGEGVNAVARAESRRGVPSSIASKGEASIVCV